MKPQTFRPLHNNVLIQRDEPLGQIGNIVLPDESKKRQQMGTVLAVGPGKYPNTKAGFPMERIPMTVKVGERVLFNKYSGHSTDPEDDECLFVLMEEENVLAVID